VAGPRRTTADHGGPRRENLLPRHEHGMDTAGHRRATIGLSVTCEFPSVLFWVFAGFRGCFWRPVRLPENAFPMVFWSFRCVPVSGGPFTSVAPAVSPGAMILNSKRGSGKASKPRATEANGPTETEWRRQPHNCGTSRRAIRYCRRQSPLKSDRKAESRSIPPTRITKAKNFLFLWKGVRACGAASGPAV
jgi:hypothetical protein